MHFYLSWVDTKNGMTESYGKLMFSFFLKKLPGFFMVVAPSYILISNV